MMGSDYPETPRITPRTAPAILRGMSGDARQELNIKLRLLSSSTVNRFKTSILGGLAAAAFVYVSPLAYAMADNPFEDLYAAPHLATAEALTATYFGTTTILFRLKDDGVLTDGFFSRPGGLLYLALGNIKPNEARIADAIRRGGMPQRINAVLVSHTHHDHALDSAKVACELQAVLVGTPSLLSLQQAQLVHDGRCDRRFQQVQSKMEFGAFDVEAINAEHTPGLLLQGNIRAITMPAHFSEFKMDGIYSFRIDAGGHRLLVSAGMPVNRRQFAGAQASIVFLSIGGLRAGQEDRIEEYWNATVKASGAALVIPTHWDDFTKGLDSRLPIMPVLFGNFRATMCKLLSLAQRDGVAVRLLPTFAQFDVDHLVRVEAALPIAATHPACQDRLEK